MNAVLVLIALIAADGRAEEEASRGLQAFEAQRWDVAAEHFLRAFELSGRSAQLKNAAVSFERGGKRPEARTTWIRYAYLPDVSADRREAALAKAAELERPASPTPSIPPLEAPPPPKLVEVVAAPPPDPPTRVGPWIVFGAGLAAAIGGGALYGTALATKADYERTAESGRGLVTRDEGEAATLRSGLGIGLVSAGLCVALAGLLWPTGSGAGHAVAHP